MLTKYIFLFCTLCWRHNFALKLRVVNRCPRTLSPRYYHSAAQSGGFTLGPGTHTDLSVKNGSYSSTIWATSAASAECSSPQSNLTSNVSAIFFGDDGSYYVSLAGDALDVDICPQAGTTSDSCSCASTCSCKNGQSGPVCPRTCDYHRCDPSVEDFIVNFCPEGNVRQSTSRRTVKSTSSTFSDKVTETTTKPTPPSLSPSERLCACTPEMLWLDIIIAADNSANMGHIGLSQIETVLASTIGGITIGQGLVQMSRVALVSYASNANIIANLTDYTNSMDLMEALFTITSSNDDQVNVLDALTMAEVIRKGVKGSETRQTVVVLVVSAYNGTRNTDLIQFAEQIKESGVTLITISFVRNNEGDEEVRKISNLASPGFSFRTDRDQSTLAIRIRRALCQVNCFCPNGWVQVADDFLKPTTKYAECVRLSPLPSTWFGASRACKNEVNSNAFLASERSDAKHKFHADYLRRISGKVQPYFVGLSWDDARHQYLWSEKFDNGTQIPLDPSGYQAWASGNGNHRENPDGVQVVPSGLDTYWYDVDQNGTIGAYLCQVNACDTDKYCDDSVDDDQ